MYINYLDMVALRNRNIDNLDILLRLLLVHFGILNLMHNVHACNCAPENRMLVIEPRLTRRELISLSYSSQFRTH